MLQETPGIDVILLDMHMAPMDGLAVLAVLRSQPETRNLPVICISAHARFEDQAQAMAAGANGYVVKPFRRRKLIAAVETALREMGRLRPEDSIEPS